MHALSPLFSGRRRNPIKRSGSQARERQTGEAAAAFIVRSSVGWLLDRSAAPTSGGDIFTAVAFLIGNGLRSSGKKSAPPSASVRRRFDEAAIAAAAMDVIYRSRNSIAAPARPLSQQQRPKHHHHRCPSHGRIEGVVPVRILDKACGFQKGSLGT